VSPNQTRVQQLRATTPQHLRAATPRPPSRSPARRRPPAAPRSPSPHRSRP
jgi:hypothetical protein